MKILKLHGHKNNTGGIVNFQNSLAVYTKQSKLRYLYFRTGKKQDSAFLSKPFIRFFDQVLSYFYYPFYLLFHNPKVVEINSSLVPGAFKRDYIYAKITALVNPKARLVLFNHGWNYDFKNSLLQNNKKKLQSYFAMFDDIILLAKTFKIELQDELNIEEKKIHIITTAINILEYKDYRISSSSSKKLNILFLSRIEKTKGIDELLQAIPRVLKEHPHTHFNIAGTGSYLNTLKSHEIYNAYSKNITLNGYVRNTEKLSLFKKNHIFVFPSHGEGCPVSVLEALAVGLPIIYTKVGALPDILVDNKNGICISQNSINELAKAIITLISNNELRNQFHINNLKLSKQFDLSIISEKLENIYTH